MQKILALVLSVLMALTSFIPALSGKELITVDDFLAHTYIEFGMPDDMGLVSEEDIAKCGTYLNYKVCYSVLSDVSGGCFSETATFGWAKIGKIDALKAIADAKESWANKTFGEPVAEQITSDEVNFSGDFEPALAQSEFIDGNGNVLQSVPQANSSNGAQKNIDIEGLLQKLDVDFSIGNFDFGLKVTDSGFILNVGADICDGVKLQKIFDVSNLTISSKFDGNLVTNDIRSAYIRADFDCKDSSILTGSYAASLGVKGDTPMDLITAAKAGVLALMPNGGNKITVFSIQIPIPNVPSVTIGLTVGLTISVDGKISITVDSSNVKGIEIINNKVRIINEVTYGQQTYDIFADVKAVVSLNFGIYAMGICLVNVSVSAGLGANVDVYIQCDTAVYQLQMPFDLAVNLSYPINTLNNAEFCGNVRIYGILFFSVGEDSPLLKLLGLTKVWNIYDESNCVLYNLHVEDDGNNGIYIVPFCTRARTR